MSFSWIFFAICITCSYYDASSLYSKDHFRKRCGRNEFTCSDDHRCIPLFFRCDLKHHCNDGSDEEGCEAQSCPRGAHRCDEGRCIPDMFVCDGEIDCIDLSDEKDCPHSRKQCGENAFTCSGDHRCIPLFFRCDLKHHCKDGSDEEGCEEQSCPGGTRRCDWGRCIPDMFFCDGEIDCFDLSDEKDCDRQDLPNEPQPSEPTKPTQKLIPSVDDQCMQCLCQAASGCDTNRKCVKGSTADLCGPYVAYVGYWSDGGRHGDKGHPKDFETCLNNKTCAEQTVRGYMNRYGQDCDQDSRITCDDFVRIHKLGPNACGDAIQNTNYWKRYEACKKSKRIP